MMLATTLKAPLVAATLAALVLTGCTPFLQPDPLNKTASIVNGTQVTRGPVRSSVSSGFADTAAPAGSTFGAGSSGTPVGEPFSVDELSSFGASDASLPELQNIDFGAEQGFIDQNQLDFVNSGTIGSDPASFASDIGQAVYFATDSSDLNERARETLRRQAAWLKVNGAARVTIEGHADERGTREYNLALGDRRASATRGYLIAVGIEESRIDKISYGKERPVALGSDPEAWAQNRRTETVVEAGSDFGGGFVDNPLSSGGDVAGIGNLTIDAEQPIGLDPFASDTFSSGLTLDPDPLFADPLPAPTVDPLYSGDIGVSQPATTFDSPAPGTITYDSGPSTTLYGTTGSISPTVFDGGQTVTTTTVTDTPTTTTGATRIEDVSVDDLLRDPSLIDRIGTPDTTTTTTPGS